MQKTKKFAISNTEARRRSKPIFTTEDTEGHGGELETKNLPQGREENQIKAIKFAQKTKEFAISNTENAKILFAADMR